ncbi:MAG: prolyl oligopeptidase family serine peptidase [Candidatus Kerfeldbacteria bacterium]|nr:prolyl oligopeptidase family serine peptidase [Candidatus Kerfeldbacteria bacterium]
MTLSLYLVKRSAISFHPTKLRRNFPRLTKPGVQRIRSYADDIRVESITYLSDGLRVKGFLAYPKKRGQYPCIIYNRGGNREFGALNELKAWGELGQMAAWGYIVIGSQYRGNAGGEGHEEFGGKDLRDVLNLIPYLKQIRGADTKRIGLYGFSRGGMMSLLALKQPGLFRAAVVGAPVVDLIHEKRPEMRRVAKTLIGKTGQSLLRELRKRSAFYWPEKIDPKVPILLVQGSADWRVDPEITAQFAGLLLKHKRPVRYVLFEGADHGIREYKSELRQMTKDWFDRFLKRRETLPNLKLHGE